MDNRIKVGIRVRPLSEMEQQSSSSPSPVICEQGNQRITVGLDNRNRSSFAFDWCYSPASPSGSIYEQMCLPLINKVFEGYHATFFACKFVAFSIVPLLWRRYVFIDPFVSSK